MARFHSLLAYTLARETLREVAHITERMHGFGDLANQMRRAAISVVSNICEGTASGSDRQFDRYLTIARASTNELQGQLIIVADLGELDLEHSIHDRCDHLGRALTKSLRSLTGQARMRLGNRSQNRNLAIARFPRKIQKNDSIE